MTEATETVAIEHAITELPLELLSVLILAKWCGVLWDSGEVDVSICSGRSELVDPKYGAPLTYMHLRMGFLLAFRGLPRSAVAALIQIWVFHRSMALFARAVWIHRDMAERLQQQGASRCFEK